MKTFIELPAMYDGAKARRIAKAGRVELLRVIEEPPYWFVRIRAFNEKRDRSRFLQAGSAFGNGYWRFGHYDLACDKFAELAKQPEAIKEAKASEILRGKNRERVQNMIRDGKWHPKTKASQKSATALEGNGQ
jgi:hypothetical protein